MSTFHCTTWMYNTVTAPNKCIGIWQLTSVPHITKHKTDIGQLLHTVLSGRNDLCLWGVLVSGCTCVVEQFYELLSHEHEKWCCIYIQNELMLTEANKLHAPLTQWACKVLHCTCPPLTVVFLATQNGGVVSAPSFFTFGYVRCSLNALPCSKYMYCITSAILTNCGQSFRTSNEHQPGCLQTTEVFTNTVYRACRVSRQEYSLSLRLTPMAYCNF